MRGLKIHRLCLNRHLPKVDHIADHSHAHSQILLYLGGAGLQKIAGQTHEIRRGSLFFRAAAHAPFLHRRQRLQAAVPGPRFRPGTRRTAPRAAVLVRTLTLLDLKRVRQELALLTRWRTGHEEVEPREAAAVLRLIDLFFRALGFLAARRSAGGRQPPAKPCTACSAKPTAHRESLAALARRIGYQPDYLNRMLKQVCGLTLGEMPQRRPAANRAALAGADAAHRRGRGGGGLRRPQLFLPLVPRADRLHADRLAGGGVIASSEGQLAQEKVGFVLFHAGLFLTPDRKSGQVIRVSSSPVALITGASRGIGRGIALELAALGTHDLVINYAGNETAAREARRSAARRRRRRAARRDRAGRHFPGRRPRADDRFRGAKPSAGWTCW